MCEIFLGSGNNKETWSISCPKLIKLKFSQLENNFEIEKKLSSFSN